jgi:hypothetical protein
MQTALSAEWPKGTFGLGLRHELGEDTCAWHLIDLRLSDATDTPSSLSQIMPVVHRWIVSNVREDPSSRFIRAFKLPQF